MVALPRLGPDSPLLANRRRNPRSLDRDIEHQEQKRLFARIDAEMERIPELANAYAIPNETGGRGKATGQRLKAEGRRAGVFDVNLDVPRGGFAGLRLEMKAAWTVLVEGRPRKRRGSPSAEQKEWFRRYVRAGYAACVCYSADEAWQTILDYLAGRYEQPAKITPGARE